MRRILLVMVLLLLSSCHLKQDETFVNPVFYGKLESQTNLWDVTITPTTFDKDNRPGATWHEDCEMWKNEPDEVVLRCTHQLNKEQLEMQAMRKPENPKTEEHNTYVIKIMPEKDQDSDEGIYVVIISYYEDETRSEFASKRGYLIRTPEKEKP